MVKKGKWCIFTYCTNTNHLKKFNRKNYLLIFTDLKGIYRYKRQR